MSAAPPWHVVVVGAGGFGSEVLGYLRDSFPSETHRPAGLLDDRPDPERIEAFGLPYLGTLGSYVPDERDRLVVAIGEPRARMNAVRRLDARGARFLTVVHPKAYVAASAQIGEGCIIAPFAAVGAGAVLGKQVQLHFFASAAHDTIIGDGSAVSPYVAVNGGAALGEGVFLGTRVTINPGKRVGAFAKVTAGSVVYQDVPPGAIASGNPAKSRVLHLGTGTRWATGEADAGDTRS